MTWADERDRRLRETAKAAVARKATATLRESRDYYEKKADDISLPKGERAQWARLAEELSARLGDRRDDTGEQEELF